MIGRPLIPQLVAAGHEVVATTRSAAKADDLRRLGATPAVLDALDADAVRRAVAEAQPEAIIHQLTALPAAYEPAKPAFYEGTNRLRTEGMRNLLDAGRAAGVRRFVFQSICFMHKMEGPPVLDENAPLAYDSPEPFATALRSTVEGERMVLDAGGVVLRYGQLYGPGTYFSAGGYFGIRARRRSLPVVGGGSGVFSFLSVDDAASAAVVALERGGGIYNVADDEPAPTREWIPVFCSAVGAPKPWRVPLWLARIVAGSYVAESMANFRGASNARARAELGWAPRLASWRQGFYEMASAGGGSSAR